MDLREIRRQVQARRRVRENFRRSRFTRVGAVVRRFGLDHTFCRLLAGMDERRSGVLARTHGGKAKDLHELPLFFLATPEEYALIQEIIHLSDNPYLAFASDPEEILLSGWLYKKFPELEPELLTTRHFASLLLRGGGEAPDPRGGSRPFHPTL
uniref:Uncharacterized protein n=1 Tax=Desulfobacca acetoxidans TaxID=60893 RepID=A0A7V4G7G5_9BACT